MKPIGTKPGRSSGSLPSESPRPDDSSVTRSRIRSRETARLEDIIGVPPVTAANASASLSDQLGAALRNAVHGAQGENELRHAVAAAWQRYGEATFVGWFSPGGKKIGEASQLVPLVEGAQPQADCAELCAATTAAGASQSLRISDATTMSAVFVRGTCGECLVLVQPRSVSEATQVWLDYSAAALAEATACELRQRAERAASDTAALVELLSLVTAEKTEEAGQQRLVDELRRHLEADRVYLGVSDATRPLCGLRVISDCLEIDRQSAETQQVEAVLQESLARADASLWPSVGDENRHALLAHQQLAESSGALAVLATPLRSESGDVVGVVAATFAKESADDDSRYSRVFSFLRASSRSLGTTIDALRRSHQSAIGRWSSGVWRRLRSNVGIAVSVAVTMLMALLLVPMDYRVRCEAELQPVSRRYVAAPFEASLKSCFVDPGDVVEANQILAELDGREVQWELSGLRADIKKANKEHNTHLSRQAFGEASIARHEVERLGHRADMLEDRKQNLAIRSPVAGVVVTGDLREREGVPLEMGQSLFEIAPLDALVIEVGIPEDDIQHVAAGMTIRLRLHSLPESSIEATIRRIHPKAELRDHENVFVAEAVIENTDHRLRPGMKGAALVSTGRRPLGWNLLHKPVAHVVGWLGW